jgi:hypothetical protein
VLSLSRGRGALIERNRGEVEQRRIVAKIEALFAQADAIEQAVNIARQRADAKRVDQAILTQAFRGEL